MKIDKCGISVIVYDQQDTLKEKVDMCNEADLQFNMKLYIKLNLDFGFEPV